MKITEIKYSEDNGDIKVVDIVNASTISMIVNEFGKDVLNKYIRLRPCYFHNNRDGVIICFYGGSRMKVVIGDIYTKEDFSIIISTLKQAGRTFAKAVKESKIKTIKI